MGAHTWNIIGLVLVMVGVIVLFAFGMPYRVRSGGAINLILNERDDAAEDRDRPFGSAGRLSPTLKEDDVL